MLFAIGAIYTTAKADWRSDLDRLLRVEPGAGRDSVIQAIAKARPDWREVVAAIKATPFPDTARGDIYLRNITCIDGVVRPWVIYVPPSYNPKTPTPLLIMLHGSVSRPEIMEDPVDWARQEPYVPLAAQRGWIVVFPMGQAGATWWDGVGMANILNQVRATRQQYNIDDDRVYLGGFSDGGSGAFLFGMAAPSDFGALVALNGHMGVASEDGNLPTYAPNLYNTPVYAVTTDKDQLYPSSAMEKLIDMARNAGGNIHYRQLEGDHSFSYAEQELPLIADFLERHPRDPFPSRLVWETAIPGLGVCRWFAIDSVTTEEPADWHTDYNTSLIDSSIIIGFQPDEEFSGPGIRVAGLADGDYLAGRIGLRAGDIIIGGNDVPIKSADDLSKFKTTLRRGAPVSLQIRRDTTELVLSGRMPAAENYLAFNRTQPSARANVSFSANRVFIESSRVGAFRIFVAPEMVNLNQKLSIYVNEQLVFDSKVTPDLNYILRNYLANRDRKAIYVNEVRVDLHKQGN